MDERKSVNHAGHLSRINLAEVLVRSILDRAPCERELEVVADGLWGGRVEENFEILVLNRKMTEAERVKFSGLLCIPDETLGRVIAAMRRAMRKNVAPLSVTSASQEASGAVKELEEKNMAYADAEPMTHTDGVNFGSEEAAAYRKEAEAIADMQQLRKEVAYEATVERVYGLPPTERHRLLAEKLGKLVEETFL